MDSVFGLKTPPKTPYTILLVITKLYNKALLNHTAFLLNIGSDRILSVQSGLQIGLLAKTMLESKILNSRIIIINAIILTQVSENISGTLTYTFNRMELKMRRHTITLSILLAFLSVYSCQAATITTPPAELNLDPFYAKYLDCDGIIVIGSKNVSDKAFYRLQELLDSILAFRPDLRKTLVEAGFRYIIVGKDEQITDVPEYSHMEPKAFWNQRARGFGGRTTSCGEENVLNLPGDRYDDESILIHELAHGIHHPGLHDCDPSFQGKLDALYKKAMDKGIYEYDYASTNAAEYWAESVQAFFDCDRENNWNHNNINTREELIKYDPEMADFVKEIFRITDDNDWRYKPLNKLPLVENKTTPGYSDKFTKQVTFWEFLVLGTEDAPDSLMLQSADIVRSMFRYRYDVLKTMIDANVTLVVYDNLPSDLQNKQLRVKDYITEEKYVFSEMPDKLQIAIDSKNSKQLVHDLATALYLYTGLRPEDPEFDKRRQKQQYEIRLERLDYHFDQKVKKLFDNAIEKGLWKSTLMAENRFEYFAYGVCLYYEADAVKLSSGKTISTRQQLADYDPDLEKLIADIFKHSQRTDWRYAMSK